MPWYASIRFKVAAMVILPVVVIFLLFVWNSQRLLDRMVVESARSTVEKFAQTLNLALSPYTDSEESLRAVVPFLQELVGEDAGGLEYLLLTDESGTIIANTENVPSPLPAPDGDFEQLEGRNILHVSRPILLGLSGVGELRYGLSIRSLHEEAERLYDTNLQESLFSLSIVLGLIAAVAGLMLVHLNIRLGGLVDSSKTITRGNYDLVVDESGKDEISVLSRQMNIMASSIKQRVNELEENEREIRSLNEDLQLQSEELTATLENLEHTQENLIQAEKMAGLGSVVAAVSHELNTPVGNALTVASGFTEKTKAFHIALESGLRKSVLNAYLEDSKNAADILERNLTKAAELINSFKHVAVDQTSAKRRTFQLDRVIEDVLLTLRPSIKHSGIDIELDLDRDVEMNSYPGPLGQVITNLFNNALTHAFEDREEGMMRITTRKLSEHQTELLFADNGCGISAEHQSKLFDPFFTTKLGKGGSGLGMHIVYNLVTSVLAGTIHVESVVGEGTTFRIQFPLSPASSPEAA